MLKFERKLTFYGLPTLIQDLLIRLRLVHVSCSGAMEEPGYDFPNKLPRRKQRGINGQNSKPLSRQAAGNSTLRD